MWEYTLSVVVTLITIVDPFGLVPVYLPIAQNFNKKERRKLILRSTSLAFLVSLIFLFIGRPVFNYLGISFESIYIVGGILLFLIGLDMMYARPSRTKSSPQEREEVASLSDVTVFPLAFPMLSGPGLIASIVMFSSKNSTTFGHLAIFIGLVSAFFLAALAMLFADKLLKVLGKTGLNVIDRIIGMILAALAVQFIINAITSLVTKM